MRNQTSVTGVGDCEIVVGQIETMGSLAKPSAVAKCTISDGFSVEESLTILDKPDVDLTHSMRTMMNPDGDHKKSAPQSETVGCLVESLVEVECPVSDDSCAEKPLITLGKAETEGVRASVGLVLSNSVLSLSGVEVGGFGVQDGDKGGRADCANDV